MIKITFVVYYCCCTGDVSEQKDVEQADNRRKKPFVFKKLSNRLMRKDRTTVHIERFSTSFFAFLVPLHSLEVEKMCGYCMQYTWHMRFSDLRHRTC